MFLEGSFILRLKLKWGDVLVTITVVVAAVLLYYNFYEENSASKTAVITQNNVILDRIRLDQLTEHYTINYSGPYPGTIEAEHGKIRFSHAQCPDQVCVETGWITRPGEIAVCLPAGVIIKIEGGDSDLDIILK